MPSTDVGPKNSSLTANGTNEGVAKIGDNTGWLVGAHVHIVDDDADSSKECVIVEQVGNDSVRLRFLTSSVKARGGFSDITAYTVAKHAALNLPYQIVAVRALFVGREQA